MSSHDYLVAYLSGMNAAFVIGALAALGVAIYLRRRPDLLAKMGWRSRHGVVFTLTAVGFVGFGLSAICTGILKYMSGETGYAGVSWLLALVCLTVVGKNLRRFVSRMSIPRRA